MSDEKVQTGPDVATEAADGADARFQDAYDAGVRDAVGELKECRLEYRARSERLQMYADSVGAVVEAYKGDSDVALDTLDVLFRAMQAIADDDLPQPPAKGGSPR